MAIFLFAGHNNKDPGAIGVGGVREADLTKELRGLVISHMDGKHKVIIDNDAESLAQLIRRIQPGDGSVVLDIHFNSASTTQARGTETLVRDNVPQAANAYKMALELTDKISSVMGTINRGVKSESASHRGRLGILHGEGQRALVEVAFISSPDDLARYQKNKGAIAKIIADTLMRYDDLI